MRAFTEGNYPHQHVACQIVESLNLSLKLKFKSDVIKEVGYVKMVNSFTAVEVLMKHTFFTIVPFLFMLMETKDVPCSFLS